MKNQTSLEFITTYAWALVIILVVIVALLFYSNAESVVIKEAECNLGPQFSCEGVVVDSYGQLSISFVNNINDAVQVNEITFKEKIGVCPLPLTIKKGGLAVINCQIDDPLINKDLEDFLFDINFTTEKSGDNFVSKGKVTVAVIEEIENFVINCDKDGDGYDSYSCGGIDCDDEDPLNWSSICSQDSDCGDPVIMDCINPTQCDAYCYNSCDEDGDGRIAVSCGGLDCDDNDANVWRAFCYENSNCRSGEICRYPGRCNAACVLDATLPPGPIGP